MHPTTQLIHYPYQPPEGFDAPQPAVHKASTVIFPNVAAMRTRNWQDKSGYTYGLHGTPTTFTLEERLCAIEGGSHCVLVPSGLAAIATALLALLKTGDEVLIPDNAYGPMQDLARGELAAYGITHQRYDPMDVADLAAKITPRTQLIWLEAAGSVTLEFPDLLAQVRLCRERGITSVIDNTWGAGLAFCPFDVDGEGLGVDVSVHALTKYPSGGGDVLMGSVMTRDAALHRRILLTHMRLGLGVSGNDAEAVLRSLPSMDIRYARHDTTARALAAWCQGRPELSQVIHPALAGSPGHEHWRAVCGAHHNGHGRAAGLFSVVFKPQYTTAQVDAFCDALRLFKLGYSWAGPISLVVPYDLSAMRPRWPAHLQPGHLVRLCVGLEDAGDLQNDIAQALTVLA